MLQKFYPIGHFSYYPLFPISERRVTVCNQKQNNHAPKSARNVKNRNSESYCWSTEKLVDTLMNNYSDVEKNWVETGLPDLLKT